MNRKKCFEAYLNGTATAEEKELVAAWVTGLMAQVSDGEATEEQQHIVAYWLAQENIIPLYGAEMEKRKKETRSYIEQEYFSLPQQKKHIAFYRYAAAAVIVFALGFGTFFVYNTAQEKTGIPGLHYPVADRVNNNRIIYQAAPDQPVKKIQLPDSSYIYLNANAILSLDSSRFNTSARDVTLESGEAFFQVAKNPHKKFTVRFGNLQAEVLGTSFNIENRENADHKRLFVKTGKVAVKGAEGVMVTLTAGETFMFDTKTATYKVIKDNNPDYTKWINGDLIFSGAGLDEIKQKLEQRLGSTVVIQDNALPQTIQLNAIFGKEDSADKIARIIADIYGARFRIQTGRIVFYK